MESSVVRTRRALYPERINEFTARVGHTSRGARRPALVGLRLRQHELQRSTLVLLAQRRASEGDKNGSVGQGVADASGVERCVAGMEVAERIQRTWGFRFPISSPQREEAAGPCRRSEKEGPTGVCEGWHHRSGLAHVSAHGWDDAIGDSRSHLTTEACPEIGVGVGQPDIFCSARTEEQFQGAIASTYALNVGMFFPLWSRIAFALPQTARTPQIEPSFLFLRKFKLFSIWRDTFFFLSAD